MSRRDSARYLRMHTCLCLVAFFLCRLTDSFSFSDLKNIKKSCAEFNSCEAGKDSRRGFILDTSRTCKCDVLCAEYGDCCLDSPFYKRERQGEGAYSCSSLVNYNYIYMKTTCPVTWTDSDIHDKCIEGLQSLDSLGRDPLSQLPVTSHDTGITYANRFCAICNGDMDDVELWQARLECPRLEKSFNKSKVTRVPYYSDPDRNWMVDVSREDAIEPSPCHIYPFIPETVQHLIRACSESISSCSSNWTELGTESLCRSYISVVYNRETSYRNYHCALCNQVPPENLSCVRPLLRSDFFFNKFHEFSFALLFDFNGESEGNSVGMVKKCKDNEVWDSLALKCRNVKCRLEDAVFLNGKCHVVQPVTDPAKTKEVQAVSAVPSTTPERSSVTSPDHEMTSIDWIESEVSTAEGNHETLPTHQINATDADLTQSLNCDKILLAPSEFVRYSNGTVYVHNYSRTYNPGEYDMFRDGILVCNVDFTQVKFSSWMGLVTVIGLGLSLFGLFMYFVAFAAVPDLRNLSGKNLCSLCVALFCGYVCFILSALSTDYQETCVLYGFLTCYFFIASFGWMNVLSFDIWRTLQLATSQLRVSSGEQWCKFVAYSLYGWFLSAVYVTLIYLVDFYKPSYLPVSYLPNIGSNICWFNNRNGLLLFFTVPFTAMMIFNILCFILSARVITDTAQSTSQMKSSAGHQVQFKLYMRLALLMGLTWISGIVAGYLNQEVIWYIFIVMQTLQGAFIFFAFVCTRKVCRVLGGPCYYKCRLRNYFTFWSSTSERSNVDYQVSNNSNLSHSSQNSRSQLTTNASKCSINSV